MVHQETQVAVDTVTNKERFGIKRRKHLSRMCGIALFIFVMAVGAVVVGSITSTLGRSFIFVVNSVGAAGGLCILSTVLTFCFVIMAKRVRGGEKFPFCVRCMSSFTHVTMGFTWPALLFGLGFGGIWGMIECHQRLSGRISMSNSCHGDTLSLFILSSISLAMVAILIVALLILQCMFCSKNLGYVWQGRYLVYGGVESEDQTSQPSGVHVTQPAVDHATQSAVQMETGIQGYPGGSQSGHDGSSQDYILEYLGLLNGNNQKPSPSDENLPPSYEDAVKNYS